jgi:hypothetical protein
VSGCILLVKFSISEPRPFYYRATEIPNIPCQIFGYILGFLKLVFALPLTKFGLHFTRALFQILHYQWGKLEGQIKGRLQQVQKTSTGNEGEGFISYTSDDSSPPFFHLFVDHCFHK